MINEKIRRVYFCSHNAYSKNIYLKKSSDSGFTVCVGGGGRCVGVCVWVCVCVGVCVCVSSLLNLATDRGQHYKRCHDRHGG
jgi:hypothetical protein